MSSPVLPALAVLVAVVALLVLGLRALAAAGRRLQQPTTADTDERADETPAALVEPPADIDEWTTDLELERRDHLALNGVETELRDGLDDAYARFLNVLGVAVEDLIEHPGFPGVRELVGVA